MDIEEVNSLLQDSYESLSPQLRQAARYLLAHPEEIALTSMRRIASHAGVKPSTMVRLARAVGLDGFEELREPYRRWLRGGEGAYEARARTLQGRGSEDATGLITEIQEADSASLADACGPAATAAVLAAAEVLTDARRVYVLGLRSCYALAHYFHYAYSMVRSDTRLVDGVGGTSLDAIRGIGWGDVMLIASFRPYSREAVQAVQMAVDAGAQVVAVTDSSVSPVARLASHVLVVETASPNFFHSLLAPLSVLQQLLAAAVVRTGPEGLAAIHEAESRLKTLDAYWHEPRRRRNDGRGKSSNDVSSSAAEVF